MRERRNPLDVEIGQNIRSLRMLRGVSQKQLGQALNVRFQQVQKYERGTNRVSAGRLLLVAQALGVEIAYFYEKATATAPIPGLEKGGELLRFGASERALLQAFQRITDETVRKRVLQLVQSLSDEQPQEIARLPDDDLAAS